MIIIADDDIKNQIESILFACGRKMSVDELSILLGIRVKEIVKDKLVALQKEYQGKNASLMIVDEGDEWKITTKEKYLPLVRKINPHTELSKTVMETLAVIAWKQPTRQSDVIKIRTNKAYEHIEELERMGFLVKEKYGRSYLLKLTQKFYDYFDLKDAQAARQMFQGISAPALEEMEQTKVDEFDSETSEEEKDIEGTVDKIKSNENSALEAAEKDEEENTAENKEKISEEEKD